MPALLFENPSHPRQHQVAFEVSQVIVDRLELVQINHHHRKCTAGARGPAPFRFNGFKEVAARFEAGQAVGDRLILHLLKRHRVVERGREHIGQGAEREDLFLGESSSRECLDGKHSEQRLAVGDRMT